MQNDRLENKPQVRREDEQPEELTTQDLVRKHLEDKDHVITDEELQKLKVGQQNNEEYAAGVESQTYFEGEEDKDKKEDQKDDDEENPVRPTTPWDVVG
jgi:hypothetical protein